MKEEDDYNEQLAKKQSTVARLRTQLALAQLDTSEAGKARVRELQAKLSEAEDDLEDFTLSHAVDVITQALDNQYSEYEKMMDDHLKSIDDQIANVAKTIQASSKSIEELLEEYKNSIVDPRTKAAEGAEDNSGVTITLNYNPTIHGGTTEIKNSTEDAAEWFVNTLDNLFGRAKATRGLTLEAIK